MKKLITLLASSLIAATMVASASAASLTVKDNPNTGRGVFFENLYSTIEINTGTDRRVNAGVFALQYGSNAGTSFTDFLTFCLQVNESLTLPLDHDRVTGEVYFSEEDRKALGTAYGSMMTEEYALADGISAAAMQSIMWEVAEDGATSFDLSSGAFILLTQDVRTKAEEFWVLIQSGTLPFIGFDVFIASGTQDLITTETPLPGAALFMGTGIAAYMSRKRKKATA